MALDAGKGTRRATTRRRDDAVNRAKIVGVAARLFRQRGYHATSMQDIADELSVLKGSLYHHISSKEELLVEMLLESVSDVVDAVRVIAEGPGDARSRLRAIIRTEIEGMAKRPDELAVWLSERLRMGDVLTTVSEVADLGDRIVRDVVEQGIAAGEWAPRDPSVAFLAIRGMVAGFAFWYRSDGPLAAGEIADRFADFAERILDDGPADERPVPAA